MAKAGHHGTSAEVQEFIRKRAVIAIEDQGCRAADVAKVLGVDERRVYEWLAIYREQGLEGLDKKPRLGSEPMLSEWEMQKVKEIVTERTPRMYGYEQEVWTARLVSQVIADILQVTMSESAVARLLSRLGFSYRRAAEQAIERSDEAVERWLQEEFPAIQEEAQREGRIIYFEDEVGITTPGSSVRGWFPKGQPAFVRTTGTHLHLTVLGAISSTGAIRFHLSAIHTKPLCHDRFHQASIGVRSFLLPGKRKDLTLPSVFRRSTTMPKRYRSDALAAIHETMEALHEIGAVDRKTMREFDDACLTPVRSFAPEEIRAIREREHLSQPVFARYLNVSKNLVSDWERGVKKPGGPALRLLTVVQQKGIQAIA